MNHLRTILAALLLAAAPAAGQTIKTLGYNTTNGNVVAATNLTFTNSLNFATNARASTRTNLGLGTTDAVTFDRLQLNNASSGLTIGGMQLTAPSAGLDFAFTRTGTTNMVLSTNGLTLHVGGFAFSGGNTTGAAITRTNLGLGATNNVTFNELTVKSLTTTDPVGWALDAVQTAAATNGVLTLPDAANVLRITNANAISSVTNGRLGAFYYLVNQTTNNLTISNAGGITVQGGTPLTLGASQAATLVATGPTNASVAARGNLDDVTLGGTANTAPNQTASSGSSIMTRDLSDARFPPIPLLSHWAPLLSVPTQLFTNNSGTISGTAVASSYATVTTNANSSVSAIFQGSAFSVLNDSLYPVDGAGNGIVFRGQLTPDGTNRLGRFLFSSAASRSDFNTVITNVGTNGIAANGWAVETRLLSSGVKEMRLIVYNATAGVTNISESAWTAMAGGSRYNQIIAVVPGTSTTKLYYTNGFAARLGTNPAITVSNTPAGSKLGTAGAFGFALVSTNTASGAADLFVKDIYQFVGANQFGF